MSYFFRNAIFDLSFNVEGLILDKRKRISPFYKYTIGYDKLVRIQSANFTVEA